MWFKRGFTGAEFTTQSAKHGANYNTPKTHENQQKHLKNTLNQVKLQESERQGTKKFILTTLFGNTLIVGGEECQETD